MRTIIIIIFLVLCAGTCKAQDFVNPEFYQCGASFDLINAEQRKYDDNDGHWEYKDIMFNMIGRKVIFGNPHLSYILQFKNDELTDISILEYDFEWSETTIILDCPKGDENNKKDSLVITLFNLFKLKI